MEDGHPQRRTEQRSDDAKLLVADERGQSLGPLVTLKHNGQRWCALAVQDYESRALPLSYGGGDPKLATRRSRRYSAASPSLHSLAHDQR